jgi:hypothetical protein
VKEHGETKNGFSKPPQPPNHRACVKIHEQKSNIILGDNGYNYWYFLIDVGKTSRRAEGTRINPTA